MRKTLLFVVAVFLVLQVFRPEHSNQSALPNAANINNVMVVPADIDLLLKTSCYDCHSNHSNYPWYTQVQPVGWWIDRHIRDGKQELNFDAFAGYPKARQYHKLEELEEVVEEDEMPLAAYTWVHQSARLLPEQKRQLVSWSEKVRKELAAKYPADSLRRK